MAIYYNGKSVTGIHFNGTDISTVKCNGEVKFSSNPTGWKYGLKWLYKYIWKYKK